MSRRISLNPFDYYFNKQAKWDLYCAVFGHEWEEIEFDTYTHNCVTCGEKKVVWPDDSSNTST